MGNMYVLLFKIVFADPHSLQVVFGKVVEGLDIVHKIG